MKRIIILLVMLALFLSGCSKVSDPGSGVPADATPEISESLSAEGLETTMKPSAAGLIGVCSGYAFIPMGDAIYRYTSYSTEVSGVTRDELLLECVEDLEFGDDLKWEFYSLKEYLGREIILGTGLETVLFKYTPSSGVSEKDIADAINAGFVMMKDGSVIEGKDRWVEFYASVQRGEADFVDIGYSYTNEKYNMTDELFEATKEDYPSLFLNRLSYDGNLFTIEPVHRINGEYVVSYLEGFDNPSASYKYLMHYEGKAQNSFSLFTEYDRYVLTNDNTVNWDDLQRGILSSNIGEYIEFSEVYCEYNWK